MRIISSFRRFLIAVSVIALLAVVWTTWTKGVAVAQSRQGNDKDDRGDRDGDDDRDHNGGPRRIAVLDNCDPNDPGWAPTGGCLLKKGNVSFEEFGRLLLSPLTINPVVVGHPSWRNEPSYITVGFGKSFRAKNEGGRLHTFTEVVAFGGGRVPPLAVGLNPAPECALVAGATDPTAIMPGQSLKVEGLTPGLHLFQCCLHSWMRAAVRVEPK